MTRLAVAVAVLAVAGIAISAAALQLHYSAMKAEYCVFTGTAWDCDLVNRSQYARFLGVPVALIGMLGYAVLLGLVWPARRHLPSRHLLLAASLAGLAFSLYLTWVEAFVLRAWCILCVFSQGVILLIALLVVAMYFADRRPKL